MSISAPPARGYPDWQRIQNYDTGILYNLVPGLTSGSFTSPIIDVSRFEYMGGYLFELSSQCSVGLRWFIDRAGAIAVGAITLVLSANVTNGAQIRFPNLGPFLQVTVVPLAGLQYDPDVAIFATNRFHPLEFIPVNPVLVDQQNFPVAGNATAVFYPSDYYAGPVSTWCLFGQTGQLTFEYLTAGNNWDDFYQVILTANAEVTPQVVTPPGAWRCVLVNQSAVATGVYLAVVPPMTGST